MRRISKDLSLTIGGSPLSFRLTKPDAFSGVESFFRVKSEEWRVEIYADYYEGYYAHD